jgi:hypothetical protein
MVDRIDCYESDTSDLGMLVSDLRGLFVEADPHDPKIRFEFEFYWSPIDAEHELQTEAWAPPGSANDANLARSLAEFRGWVREVLEGDPTKDHR